LTTVLKSTCATKRANYSKITSTKSPIPVRDVYSPVVAGIRMDGFLPPFGSRILDAVPNSSQAQFERLSFVLWGSLGKVII
jgi:hypothetical protein